MSAAMPKPFRFTSLALTGFLLLMCGCGKAAEVGDRPLRADDSISAAATAFEQKQYDQALVLLAPSLESRPHDPNVLNLKGAILTRAKDYDGAQRCYEEVLAVSPGFFPARYNIGVLLALRQQWDPAITYFRNMLAEQPNNELLQYKLLLLLISQNLDPALQAKLFTSETPSLTPGWYFAKASRAYQNGKPSEAEGYLKVAKSVFGDQTTIFQEELEESGLVNFKK